VQRGTLVVAHTRDRGELEQLARRSAGFQRLDGDGVAALEPALAGRFEAGLWFAQEAHLDPREALPALAGALAARGGTIQFDAQVQVGDLVADAVVDCRGLAARDSWPELRGVRGETLLLQTHELGFGRPIRLLHPRHPLYLVPRSEGRLLLGATVIESDHAGPVTARSALELLNAAWALHPALAEAQILEWGVGVRPALPDHLPQLRMQGRVTHFNGLYRHGFLLAPWYARRLARQWPPAAGVAA
jgi:glycine oxidase